MIKNKYKMKFSKLKMKYFKKSDNKKSYYNIKDLLKMNNSLTYKLKKIL